MFYTRIKRLLIGQPLTRQYSPEEKLSRWKAIAVLASDALSSVAYATEEVLIPLAALSIAAMAWSMPIALAIGTLIMILMVSYRQTIVAYPGGGGAYTVARDNLGTRAGLLAGASLLIDYVLTVAVSAAAGVAALTSAFPNLLPYKEAIAVVAILILMIIHLRGIRETSVLFAIPTYLFIFSIVFLLGAGIWKLAIGDIVAAAPIIHETYPEISLFLILRAFSSGCAALTGFEVISDRVTAFQSPVSKNAQSTLAWMAGLLATFFLGITLLAHSFGIVPVHGETAISQLARGVFGDSKFYYLIQASTLLILFMAAKAAYAAFPLLAGLLAKDRFLPRQLASVGDKLVFSNGILGLSGAAIVLIVVFEGDTHALIPLYAIGAFLSFTLSQMGMVMKHVRERKPGWTQSVFFNGTGALVTCIALLVIAISKFAQGAWMVILLIPIALFVFGRIQRHYLAVGRELSLIGVEAPQRLEKMKHTVIIPISGVHRGVINAVRYGISISDDVRACYVELDPESTERTQAEWNRWAHEIPFVVLKSPYRSVIGPILEYIQDVDLTTHNEFITVIIPEFVTAKWWHSILHNQTALLIRAALAFKRGRIVTSVRYHLRDS